MKTIIAEDVITSKEAVELLNVSEGTLRVYVKKGLLDRVKDKVDLSKTYYLKSQIKSFLDTRYFIVKDSK